MSRISCVSAIFCLPLVSKVLSVSCIARKSLSVILGTMSFITSSSTSPISLVFFSTTSIFVATSDIKCRTVSAVSAVEYCSVNDWIVLSIVLSIVESSPKVFLPRVAYFLTKRLAVVIFLAISNASRARAWLMSCSSLYRTAKSVSPSSIALSYALA